MAVPVASWEAGEGASTEVATVSTGAAAVKASGPRKRAAGARRSGTSTWRRAGAARRAAFGVKMKVCGTRTAMGSSGVSHHRGGRSKTEGRRKSQGYGNSNMAGLLLGGRATVLASRVRETGVLARGGSSRRRGRRARRSPGRNRRSRRGRTRSALPRPVHRLAGNASSVAVKVTFSRSARSSRCA
jgi:hypothetical protein